MAAQPPPFSAEETAAAREVFALMDADSDGKVNHSDLKKFFDEAGWGLNDDNIAVSFIAMDKNVIARFDQWTKRSTLTLSMREPTLGVRSLTSVKI